MIHLPKWVQIIHMLTGAQFITGVAIGVVIGVVIGLAIAWKVRARR